MVTAQKPSNIEPEAFAHNGKIFQLKGEGNLSSLTKNVFVFLKIYKLKDAKVGADTAQP